MTNSANSPFRIAIVGCGRIANSHIQAVLGSDATKLVALVDSVEERAKALADRYHVDVPIHTSLAAAVGGLDGAVIATPNHLHAEHALACINAGVAVLIEKPLAVSVADGTAICEAADKANVTVAVGYVTRFRENILLMRDLLRRNHFGRVRRFAYQAGTRGGWAPLSAYNLDRATAGGGVLVVTGTHFLDRMLDWFGYPTKTRLRDDSTGGPEANAVATFEFEHPLGTIQGMSRFSKSTGLDAGIVLETDAGTVMLREHPEALITVRSPATPNLETTIAALGARARGPRPSDFVLQLEDFVAAARSRATPMVSAHHGLESLRLLNDLYSQKQQLAEDWYPTLSHSEVNA